MSDAHTEIREILQRLIRDYENGDIDSFRPYFMEDHTAIPPKGPIETGNDYCVTFMRDMWNKGLTKLKHDNVGVKVYGNVAVYHADFTWSRSNGEVVGTGRCMMVLVKDEASGEWKQSCEMWTEDK